MRDPRVPKAKEQVLRELLASLADLRYACEQWELGHREQATSIAARLRVLLYDHGRSSVSLLRQLHWLNKDFAATPLHADPQRRVRKLARQDIRSSISPAGELEYTICRWEPQYFYFRGPEADDPQYRAQFRWLPFQQWWEGDFVLADATLRTRLSRKDVVLLVGNELGGNHSAPLLNENAAALLRGEFGYGPSITEVTMAGKSVDVPTEVHPAVLRQIAYEVQLTLAKHFGEQLQQPVVVPPLPPERKAESGPVQWKQDPAGVKAFLASVREHSEVDTILALQAAAAAYWDDRKADLLIRGLY